MAQSLFKSVWGNLIQTSQNHVLFYVNTHVKLNANIQNINNNKDRDCLFQVILQECSSKTSMVLTQKQTQRSMEQNTRLKHKLMYCSHLIVDIDAKTHTRGKTASSANGAGNTGFSFTKE